MSDEQETQGFTVRDRRILATEEEEERAPEEKQASPDAQRAQPDKQPTDTSAEDVPLPDPTFSSFMNFFFVRQTLMFLGQIPELANEKNIPMAKYLIDMLAVIKEKTQGNLTDDEQKQLDTFLTDLRMLYVKSVAK